MLGAGLGGAGPAQADDFTVGGAFDDLNDVVLIEFSHPGGAFLAFTSQWNNRDGAAPPAADPALDGFDAQLQLFTGTGPTATFDVDNDAAAKAPRSNAFRRSAARRSPGGLGIRCSTSACWPPATTPWG